MILEGALVSLALGLLGCFLVVRGMSLLGDALSHSVLPGIVVGFLVGAAFGNASLHSPWILIGATAAGLATSLLVQAVQERSRVKEDAALGIVFTAMFALGVVLINKYAGQTDLDAGCVLYGNLEYFARMSDETPHGIYPMIAITLGILAALLLFYRYLLVCTFDPALAQSLGLPVRTVNYLFLAVLSLTIVASFEAVGAILAVALLIMPGATARLWTDRMPLVLLVAAAHGITSTIVGYWLSHPAVMNTSTAGAICVAGFTLFMLSWLCSPSHGLVPRSWQRARLKQQTATENLLKAVGDLGRPRPGGAVAMAAVVADLKVPPRALERTISRAAARGWVQRHNGDIALTDAGRDRAARLVRAHELWEQYLRQEVGLDADHVHDAAEWIEHYLNDEKIDHLDEVLTPGRTR